MPTEVTVHPTAKIALIAVLIAVVVGGGLMGLKRLIRSPRTSEPAAAPSLIEVSEVGTLSGFLLPVVRVPVRPEAHESEWSEALAAVLGGRTEAATDHGRVDVLTDRFAIEVDRLAKWHESIGQASHYSETTKKRPAVALIVLPTDTFDKLELIEATCDSKGIKLLILQTTKEAQQDAPSNGR
jgi:hypothetical protein